MFNRKSGLNKLLLPSLMILLLLSIAGCGSKVSPGSTTSGSTSTTPTTTSAPTNAQSSKATTPANDAVTYENYLKIKIDSTYDDVKSILGEGKKKVSDVNPDIVTYSWGDQGKIISVRTNKGNVIAKAQTNLGKITTNLTEELFNKITTGMTLDQVVSILGPDYQETSIQKSTANVITKSLVWMMPEKKLIKVNLKGDKVSKTYNYLK